MECSSNPDSALNLARFAYNVNRKGLAETNHLNNRAIKSYYFSMLNKARAQLRREIAKAAGKTIKMREDADFTTTVMGGLPIGVVIDNYTGAKPWRQHTFNGAGPGDCDPPEDQEIEYHILDRAGYYAEWIHSKMSAQDETDIEHECVMYISQRGEL